MTILLIAGGAECLADQSDPQSTSVELRVGRIEIQTRDIFAPEEVTEATAALRFLRRSMNTLHINTRHRVLRRELLFDEGDRYRPEELAETERNLRALGFLNDIQVVATDTTADGRVNIRVSTRESWTLNTALAYSRASGGNQRWSTSLSDRNVLGNGFTLGAGIGGDEIGSFTNFWFSKRRPFGSTWQVGAYIDQPTDGHRRSATISKPFYAQNDRWGLQISFWDLSADSRYFLSNGSAVGLDATSEASLYADLPRTQTGMEAGFRVRIGSDDDPTKRIWRVGAGLRLLDSKLQVGLQSAWFLSDGQVRDLSFLLDEGQPQARDQGTTVYPYLHLESLGRSWLKRRFVLSYGPVEDLPLTWHLDLKAGPNGRAVGSTAGPSGESYRAEMLAWKFQPLFGGVLGLRGFGTAQVGARAFRTHRYEVLAGWSTARGAENTPWLTRFFAEVGQGHALSGNQAFLLGLVRGIRTLEFDGMSGDRLVRWNAEQGKVLPWTPLGLFNMGAAAFYSGGCAWWNDEQRDLGDARHELGVGLRFGPTRSSRAAITRLDLTWNTDEFGSGPVFTTTTRGTF